MQGQRRVVNVTKKVSLTLGQRDRTRDKMQPIRAAREVVGWGTGGGAA